ncbi:MAG: NAD-binding protein [Erythrobacter sp.]|nr:NAD-binding protein [Erythrobacter sp.]
MKRYAILGLNRFGCRLARELSDTDAQTLAIDHDEDRVEDIADAVNTAVIADIRDSDALSEAGVTEDHIAVVSIETNVEASALAVLALKDIGCARIFALAATDEHARILRALGADGIVMPEAEAALRFAHGERSAERSSGDTQSEEDNGSSDKGNAQS